jgi:hypothetical protein
MLVADVVADLTGGDEQIERSAVAVADGVQLGVHVAFGSTNISVAERRLPIGSKGSSGSRYSNSWRYEDVNDANQFGSQSCYAPGRRRHMGRGGWRKAR